VTVTFRCFRNSLTLIGRMAQIDGTNIPDAVGHLRHRESHVRRVRPVSTALLAIALAILVAAALPQSTTAAPGTFFVDGKRGNDANAGTLTAPFKTVRAGMWALRHGGTLNVMGYNDYVYYETNTTSQWLINGTATRPIIVQAYDYGSPRAIRPIVSGARVVKSPWTRPNATLYPHVWQTPWSTTIPGYGSSVNKFRQERVFVDTSQPLVRPKRVPKLADLEAMAGSQYWDGTNLFVHIGGWGSVAGASLDPNQHLVEVPSYKGLWVASGSSNVIIRGFRVRHAFIGVGFTGDGASSGHNIAQDIDASYNYTMGFFSKGSYNTFRNVTGRRNTIQLIKLDDGANHNLVDGVVAEQNLGQGIKISGASTAFNTITNSIFRGGRDVPKNQGQYGGHVQGIDIEQGAHDNTIAGNRIEGNRRGLMLYQISSSGLPLSGNRISDNTFVGNDAAVVLWDGKYTASQGAGVVTFRRNTYWSNTKAIVSEAATSNKTFDHETVDLSRSHAIYLKHGSVKVVNSIFSRTTGYHFYVKPLDPLSLSVDPLSVDYPYAGPLSPVHALSYSGGPVGSRWR
jgi:parallel beta-helix repeat protein